MKIALLTGLMTFGVVTIQPLQAAPIETASSAISQIVITRYTGTDDSHPKADYIWRLLIQRDGTAIYVGNKTYMKRIGRYRGTISSTNFSRVAKLFQKNNSRNSPQVAESRERAKDVFIIASGDKQETIVSYDGVKSDNLCEASKIADGLIWKIQWTKVSPSDAISD